MRPNPFLVTLLLVVLPQCSSPPPDPSCARDCDGGMPDGGSGYDAKSYELVGRFDWERRRLVATERVTLTTAPSTAFVELDAAVDVKQVRGEGGALPFVIAASSIRIDVSSLQVDTGEISFTIDYEATTSDALVASVSRDDDPVTSRVVYTDSEPFAGMKWLPAIHRPSDRAAWKVELTVGPDEDMVANGTRTKDEKHDGQRVVRYEMNDPLPTYTMAFAAGEIEHRDRTTGRVPISVWYRRGLMLDPNDMLGLLSTAMTSFENLVGPYPWPGYAVVLLPEFSGGMENTTITFTTETSGQANPGTNLQAHELAHQWFGDWVTVATFDDVWIKEGMATLLAPEADRTQRDADDKGRRFGSYFAFSPNDAIRDRALVGLAKYTSGPYQRAAWLLTQIRGRVGEVAFWQSLRQVLAKYALGSIDSESFVRSFGLDEPTVQKILRLLDEKRVPAVAIATTSDGVGTQVTLHLTDPGATMITPPVVTVVDAAGQSTSSMLLPDTPLTVIVPHGGYLAPDETDIHPDWWASFGTSFDEYAKIAPLFFPGSDGARTAFSTRTAAHQERALDAALGFIGRLELTPAAFPALYAELDSSLARRTAGFAGCSALQVPGSGAWADVLGPILSQPAMTTWATAYAGCGVDFASRTFGAELASLASGVDAQTASRFVYLSSYDYGPDATLDALAHVAVHGPSLQLREQALTRLSYQPSLRFGYSRISQEQAPRWKDFFRARLNDAKSVARFQTVWRGVLGLNDDRALTIAATKLHSLAFSEDLQRRVVCDAYTLAQAVRPEAWPEFQQAAQPWDTLGAPARAVLMAGGAGCAP